MTGAIIGSALIGAGATIWGSHEEAQAAKSAAGSSSAAQVFASQLQHQEYEQSRKDYEPWRKAGVQALRQLTQYPDFQFSSSDLTKEPGYQFTLQQGINALDRSAAARGMLQSGAQEKAITRYAENLAQGTYQNAFNRALTTYDTNLNRLQSLARIGQTTTNALAQLGQNYASNVGNLAMRNAQLQGNAYMAEGNAWSNAATGIAGITNNAIGNYLLYNYLKGGI